MPNLQPKKLKAKASPGEQINKLRAGRLAFDERYLILMEIGRYAQNRYKEYVTQNKYGYDLSLLKDALQFEPDIENFENVYYINTGNDELDMMAKYFENGTGLYNTKYRKGDRKKITSLTKGKRMRFRKPWHGMKGAYSVAGVKPIYMMRRTLKSIEFNRPYLQREIRIRLGI